MSSNRCRVRHHQWHRSGRCFKRHQTLPLPAGRKNEEAAIAKRLPFLRTIERRTDRHIVSEAQLAYQLHGLLFPPTPVRSFQSLWRAYTGIKAPERRQQEIDPLDFDVESSHPQQDSRSAGLALEIRNRQPCWGNDHRARETELSEFVTLFLEEHVDSAGPGDEVVLEDSPPQLFRSTS